MSPIRHLASELSNRIWWKAMLGPSFLILALMAWGLRAGWTWTLPLVIIIAVPLCSRWGARGLSVSFALMLFSMLIGLRHVPAPDRVWHIGIGAAVCIALLLITLTREEISVLCHSSSHRDQSQELQNQIEAKGEELRESRVTVWEVETRLESLLREHAERTIQPDTDEEQLLVQVDQLSLQCDAREREIQDLEQLVGQLLNELKSRCVPSPSALRVPPQ